MQVTQIDSASVSLIHRVYYSPFLSATVDTEYLKEVHEDEPEVFVKEEKAEASSKSRCIIT